MINAMIVRTELGNVLPKQINIWLRSNRMVTLNVTRITDAGLIGTVNGGEGCLIPFQAIDIIGGITP